MTTVKTNLRAVFRFAGADLCYFQAAVIQHQSEKGDHKSSKVFFWDTGIRNAVLNEFSLNPLRADIGALWENWVIAEIAKQNMLDDRKKNLYFRRSSSGSEVDLVIKENENISAYEIKWKKRTVRNKAFFLKYGAEVKLVDSSNLIIHHYTTDFIFIFR